MLERMIDGMKMNKPLVTIIITTHKGSDIIEECLVSALNQNYQNIEIIIVDDNGENSSEQTATSNRIKKYIDNERVFYFAHKINRNGSAARNTGVRMSTGEYIAFLDDDDILHEDSISDRVELLSKKDERYGVVFASYSNIREGYNYPDRVYNFDGDILLDFLLMKIQSPSSVLMIRRAVLKDFPEWDEEFARHQDWEYISRVCSKYYAVASPNVTVDKRVKMRNRPKKSTIFEERRLFYLNKMKYIIDSLKNDDIKDIYFEHYYDIAKEYLRHHEVLRSCKWIIKTKQPLKCAKRLVGDIINATKSRKSAI